jgi:hypothetical protein
MATTTAVETASDLRRIVSALDRINDQLGDRDQELERFEADNPGRPAEYTYRRKLLGLRCYLAVCAGQLDRFGAGLSEANAASRRRGGV